MSDNANSRLHRELHETDGAVAILDILREEMEQWLEEAQDDSKHEALENVLGHIGALETEYKHRRQKLQSQLQSQG